MREVERGLDGPLLRTDALYYLFIMASCLMHAERGPYLGIDLPRLDLPFDQSYLMGGLRSPRLID